MSLRYNQGNSSMQSVTRQAPESIRISGAAKAFLSALSPEQRATASFEFETDERFRWHYTPIPRRGVPRGDMDSGQLAAAEALIAASVSEPVSMKARQIIDLETVLGEVERRAGILSQNRIPDLYFFSVFGEPGGQEP